MFTARSPIHLCSVRFAGLSCDAGRIESDAGVPSHMDMDMDMDMYMGGPS